MNVSLLHAEAVGRRRRILDAADEVFGECGPEAPLAWVAERAGLMPDQLRRQFPDREALVIALFERGLDALASLVADLDGRADALEVVLGDLADHVACTAPMAGLWRAMPRPHPFVDQADRRVLALLLPLAERAFRAGRCRHRIDGESLLLVIDLLGGCLRGRDQVERRRLARHCTGLALRALGFEVPA